MSANLQSVAPEVPEVRIDTTNLDSVVNPPSNNDNSINATCDPTNPADVVEDSERTLWFCQLIVARPIHVFVVTLGCHVAFLLLTIFLLVGGYDLFPADFKSVPLTLEHDSTKLRVDAWRYASGSGGEDEDDNSVSVTGNGTKARETMYQQLEFFYEMKDGNILERDQLLAIEKFEKEMFKNPVYQKHVCQLEDGANCKAPLSILRLFDGTYKHIDKNFYDPEYKNIALVFCTASRLNTMKPMLAYTLGKDAKIGHTEAKCSYARTLFYTGWPLKNYKGIQDRKDEQTKKMYDYIDEAFGSTLETKSKGGVGEMNFYYSNLALRRKATRTQVVKDLCLVTISFLFIYMFMWVHVGSLWITTWAIFSIFSSFNITNLIYRIIFNYRYFGIFHVLAIFIILGIGADDVFVFVDTWKQSRQKRHAFRNLEHRLSFVYRRAAKAMFITSFTTMVAFLCNLPSPLLGISSFGIFSATLVLVNYCSIIIFLPVVVIMHKQYRRYNCCFWSSWDKPPPLAFPPTDPEAIAVVRVDKIAQAPKTEHIATFFRGPFFENVVGHKKIRYVVLLCFLVLIVVSIVFAVQLGPGEKLFRIWISSSNWEKVKDLRKAEFATSQEDNVVKVYIIWGLRNQDRSKCHHTDYKCRGTTVFDTSFDMNLPPCQKAVLDFCTKIKTLPPDEAEKLKLRRNLVTGEIETECFVEDMQQYFKDYETSPHGCIKEIPLQLPQFTPDEDTRQECQNVGSRIDLPTHAKCPANTDNSFPLKPENMRSIMADTPSLYNISGLPQEYYRFFEVGLGLFLTNGSRKGYEKNFNYQQYCKYLGATQDFATSGRCSTLGTENKYGNKLLFMAIAVNTTIPLASQGYKTVLPIYRNWEAFVSDEMKTLPTACNNAFQATIGAFNTWHWMKVQQFMVQNAITGIVIGIVLALVVLVLVTTNIYISLLATITMAMTTCSVLAAMVMFGWTLGVLESINMTLVVGLTVDYVVHVAQAYIEVSGTRRSRTKDALGHVGISVISAAFTTIGASLFMLASKIAFFMQFAIFMLCTITLSAVSALVFFPTLLALVGPEGDQGSIIPMMQAIKNFFRGKTQDHEDCQTCKGKGFHAKPDEEPTVPDDK